MGYIRSYFRDGVMPPVDTICDIEDVFFGSPKQALHTNSQDKDILDATRWLSQQFRDSQALDEYLI
jgi:hypothetical protein